MKLHSLRLGLAALLLSTSLNAWNLTLLSRYDSPNFELLDIEIAGNYAYVTAGLGGLNIIDISDPSSPATAEGLPMRLPTSRSAQMILTNLRSE